MTCGNRSMMMWCSGPSSMTHPGREKGMFGSEIKTDLQ